MEGQEGTNPVNWDDVVAENDETSFEPGEYKAVLAMKPERRVSRRNGKAYVIWVFEVQHPQGGIGRFAYYVGTPNRRTENLRLRDHLSVDPKCRVRLIEKQGVAGLVVDAVLF